MLCHLSTLNSTILTFFLLPLLSLFAQTQPGFTISISIRNEMVYTMQQSIEWLNSKQETNGTWHVEGKSDYETTALVRFALLATRQPESTQACTRATVWLAQHTLSTNETLNAYTWHLMGDTYLSSTSPRHSTNEVLQAATAALSTASPAELQRWQAACGTSCTNDFSTKVKLPQWPPAATSSNLELWEMARTVNQKFRGVYLTSEGETINWQEELAKRLVNTQKRDFQRGGCYWATQKQISEIEQTAYALLLFLEF